MAVYHPLHSSRLPKPACVFRVFYNAIEDKATPAELVIVAFLRYPLLITVINFVIELYMHLDSRG
ncbi:hypothetical protein EV360DRAFT_91153 [Lentinula raphanica]|nr:hypothetical protein EV360DRAFT_91153 [Lentinula raphanica]